MASISKHNSIATLDYLSSSPENLYLERKGLGENYLKPSKLANEIIGMLNADGGIIALGISNDGRVNDLSQLSDDVINEYRKVCHLFIKPAAKVQIEEVYLDGGGLIFLYHVDQDYETMFCRSDNDDVYKRVADSNMGPLTNEQIDKLRYDKSLRRYEDSLRGDFDPSDLATDVLEQYKSKIEFRGTLDELILKRNLASKKNNTITYKNSAILLFSDDPEKYIASAFVRYVRYEGIQELSGDEFNVIKDEKFYGNIPKIIDQLQTFLKGAIGNFFYFNSAQGKFVSVPEYPYEAVLEGLVNALFHRSYNLQGNCIYIKHFDDRLEIANSGPLPAQVTVENIRQERFSRNPRIGRVLFEMGYVRELNEGVKRIYSLMEKLMLPEPIYKDNNDIVTLILKNNPAMQRIKSVSNSLSTIEKNWDRFNSTEKSILEHLINEQSANIEDFALVTGLTIQAIRPYLNRFMESKIVERDTDKIRDIKAKYLLRKDSRS